MIVKSLKLSFKDKLGKNKMISLEYPKADLNAQTVKHKWRLW